jgi:hypothetical protein
MANNIEKLLAVIVSPAQDIEDALQQLKAERFVDTAVGSQLDIIGRIVGQPREGLVDDDYRRYIRARIAANSSSGITEDILTVAFLVVYDEVADLTLTQEGIATARLEVENLEVTADLGAILFKFVQLAASAGVRIVVQWGESAPASMFRFDSGPGFDNGHLGSVLG